MTWATAEGNYKNDTNMLPNVSETTLTENGYKTNIIINPYTTGTYATESGYKLDLAINPNGIGGKLTENNYQLNLIPEKTFPDISDVTVTNIATSRIRVGQGYSVTMNVTATNNAFNHQTLSITIYANTTAINTQTITLTSQSATTITFNWNTTGVAYGYYTLSARAQPIPGEAFTADNTLTNGVVMVTIPGDVNGDRTVDVFDVLKLKYHRSGPPPGPGGYDPNVDINGDGSIDVFDILIAKAHLGQSW